MRRWDAAARHFEAALELHRRMGSPPLVARTECEYAAMLAARDDAAGWAAAADLARHALTEAEELGMVDLASHTRGVLALLLPLAPGSTVQRS